MVNSSAYRDAMRNHAGAGAVIAASRAGRRAGLTATAICSLCDDPPLYVRGDFGSLRRLPVLQD